MDPSSLTMLGKYEIRGTLGRGAMGIVYDGWDPQIDRRVAIKTVRLPDAEDAEAIDALGRFKREAQAAGRLSHPNIVGVYDYGQTSAMAGGDIAYIVMEFVEGQSLKALLDAEERFPVAETVRVMEELLAGLQFSHARGVIHRDIKPANVMLTTDGRVKIADFGIARIESSSLTQAGTVMGTPAYMSPEQFMGQPVDARTDVYSAGVLLYQMLTGERPFEGSLTAIMHKVLNTTPPRPSELSVVAPPGLDPVVVRAMQRRPEERFSSAADFAQALRRAFEGPAEVAIANDPAPADATIIASGAGGSVLPSGGMRSAATAPRSNRPLLGGVAAAVLLLAAGGAWFALRPAGVPPPMPAAVTQPIARATPPEAAALPASSPPPPATPERQASLPEAPASVVAPSVPPPAVGPEAAAPAAPPVPAPTQAAVPPQPAPPQPASPPPASVPPANPTKTALVLPNPSAIRQALAEVARAANCALPRFSVSGEGQIGVTGPVGAGAPEAALHEAVEGAAPHAPVTWRTRGFDGPYCAALDVVRPIAQASSPFLGLNLKDEASVLKDHQPIVPMLRMPEYPAHLIVDYLSHDGSVTHLFPTRADHDKAFAANAAVTLGEPGKGVGEVGPPFGTDMIVAVASSVPLFAQRRPADGETVETYLPALRGAIDAALQRNARVAGRAIVLDTVEH